MSRDPAALPPTLADPTPGARIHGPRPPGPGRVVVSRVVLSWLGGWAALVATSLGGVSGAAVTAAAVPGDAGQADAVGVVWHAGDGFRWRALESPGTGNPGFEIARAGAGRGIPFTNRVSEAAALNNQILENGAGVALGDVDGDGWVDAYLCGSEPSNRLYRNLGHGRFGDLTAEAGVACERQFSTGAVLADVDGDDDLDLLVNGLGVGTRLFRNDGGGRFTEDQAAGLDRRAAATSMALGDLDGDGDLDLYVATYRVISARSEMPPPAVDVRRVDGQWVASPADRFIAFPLADGRAEIAEKGEPDALYWNDGRGGFRAASWTDGTFLDEDGQPLRAPPEDWGLSVLVRDLNGDGAPDIYVCNDFFRSRDQFWLNDGRGHFRAASRLAWRDMSLSSMAVDAADLDRDGRDDFLVVEMLARDHALRQRQRANAFRPEQALPFVDPRYRPEVPRNTLFRARDDGTFAEIGQAAGLAASDWNWNVAFLDVDLDGYEDVLAATGNQHDVLDLDAQGDLDRASMRGPVRTLEFYRPLPQRLLGFRNRGDLTFEENGVRWGLNEPGVAQGLALGDLDNDGDADVVVNRLNQPALVLWNQGSAPRLGIRLRGRGPNTRGIGARLEVRAEAEPGSAPAAGLVQSQVMVAGGRYLSGDDALRTFAVPVGAKRLSVEVRWPDGRRSLVRGLEPNRILEIDQASAKPAPAPAEGLRPGVPLFADVSERLGHRHRDAAFDDFARQPLLPHSLARLGPGVAWADLDGDGWEDLGVAGGTGGRMAVLRNDGGRRFVGLGDASGGSPATATPEQTAPVAWRRGNGEAALLVGTSNYEDGRSAAPVLRFDPGTGRTEAIGPDRESSAGPLAVADVDGDGDLDLFVGGRCLPGRFPRPASSTLYRNQGGRLIPDGTTNDPFAGLGMVSGAVFTDLDGDGDPDLVLACEWGPLRVFRNDAGRFIAVERELGLAEWTGCWAGITAGDFDGDGRLDLVASNLGTNTRHRLVPDRPWRLYAGDFSGAGGVDVVEACLVPEAGGYTPWRALDVFARVIPGWAARFGTLRGFATNSVERILGEALPRALVLEAATFEHRLFLNRGGRFESRPLPAEAQWAPGFGLAVADFDGDGREDVFLAQNWFDLDLDSARADAGVGVCLLGDGTGGFRVPGPGASGVHLAGQQRGAAVADFDHDGRVDLVVTQNDGATHLFRNQTGAAGVRVRLKGPAANPDGVGTALRIVTATGAGPIREVRAGGGYWSCDASVTVLARPEGEARLWVRWPGGRVVEQGLVPGVGEVTVAFPGMPAGPGR